MKAHVASNEGMLALHFLPGHAPELNLDEMVWSHMKHAGAATTLPRQDEKLQERIKAQRAAIKRTPTAGEIR